MKKVFLMFLVFPALFCGGSSNNGSGNGSALTNAILSMTADDSNTGASSKLSSVYVSTYDGLKSAVASASSGTVIYIMASTLSCSSQLVLSKEDAHVTIAAYPGYAPVLDFSAMGSLTGDNGAGIYLKGSHYTISGITVTLAPTKGLLIKAKSSSSNTARFNKIENCVFSCNGDSGVSITTGTSSGCVNDGTKAAVNYIKNCDSYMNADLGGSTGPGGNADGFSCKLDPGTGNVFYGCRSWYNSDDGWDLFNANYRVVIDTCWTWHNGDSSKYTGWSGTWGGNGNGIKTGGAYCVGNITVKNCVAFDHIYGKSGSTTKGFDQNHQSGTVTLSENLAFNNTLNYGWTDSTGTVVLSGTNYRIGSAAAFNCTVSGTSVANASSSDFYSIDESYAKASRGSDGSLPANNFGKHL